MNKKNVVTKENVKKVVDFINESIEWLWNNKESGGCCKYTLKNGLAIYVGWSEGYGEDDKKFNWYYQDGNYALNVGVKEDITYFSDYDYINFPYFKEDGECWWSGFTLRRDRTKLGMKRDAKYLLTEYVDIANELNKKDSKITF